MATHPGSSTVTTPQGKQPSRQQKPSTTCPICCETVEDTIDIKKDHDNIFCDGDCQDWLHRQYAGLSKSAFKVAAAKVDSSFHCPRCHLSHQSSEIAELKVKLVSMTKELAHLNDVVTQKDSGAIVSDVDTIHSSSTTNDHVESSIHKYEPTSTNKKPNLIFFGIPESPPGTPFNERMEHDYKAIFTSIEPLVGSDHLHPNIPDCIRLGKYKGPNLRPRPILVSFNGNKVIPSILRNSCQLPSTISVKRDLSKEERRCNSILLKEWYCLITEEGISKCAIRFKGKSLYDIIDYMGK